jgi:hypothetical protein
MFFTNNTLSGLVLLNLDYIDILLYYSFGGET